ncbi:hypothetical protein RM553_13975 [Zunongwangia sp. F363]|uniref:Uncharacterized protein n=1 Tax=Autumnicola tepida TaxID=3075595 RepID=A0ABU3CC73_9FLAO|nr:hypothetical protein [Zunongwangia sp. F363]MDT0643941.1 hypothetical protein [Zunongwangia sp. F363]
MAKLVIKRNSEWANKMRSFEIWLDGNFLDKINDREILEFELPSGVHTLQAKIDWCGSRLLELEFAEDEVKMVELTGFVLSKWLLPVALVNALLLFYLDAVYDVNSLFLGFLMFLFLGYLFYFFTFGRNDYLQLKIIS